MDNISIRWTGLSREAHSGQLIRVWKETAVISSPTWGPHKATYNAYIADRGEAPGGEGLGRSCLVLKSVCDTSFTDRGMKPSPGEGAVGPVGPDSASGGENILACSYDL